jgi:sarcosine oxidase subunit delta
MLLINCPWCGERDMVEFTHGGDATKIYPKDPDAAAPEEWHDFVYLRDNPRGVHDEYWHHIAGCRQWLKVRRDTTTHDILTTAPADRDLDS